MTHEHVLSFIENSIPSMWTLELLLFLKQVAPSGRTLEDLVSELRSSTTAMAASLRSLQDAGLCIEEAGSYSFCPISRSRRLLVAEVERLHAERPNLLARIIAQARS